MLRKVNVADMLARFDDTWSPRIVAELNGQAVKLVKLNGRFVWHRHDDADELFYVLEGRLRIQFAEEAIVLQPGEFLVVPRGVEHRPVADEETPVLLFEPLGTLNTGNVDDEAFTVKDPPRL